MRSVRFALAGAALVASSGAALAVSFSQADGNKDGYVTYAEAVKVFPRLKMVHFRKCDPSADGKIDADEFPMLNNFYWIIYKEAN